MINAHELKLCMDAIAKHPLGKEVAQGVPAEIYFSDSSEGKWIYLNFLDPASLAINDIYRTWIVRFKADEVGDVSYFLSRKGQHGDDTLP